MKRSSLMSTGLDFRLVILGPHCRLEGTVMDSADSLFERENRPTNVGADDSYCKLTH